MTKLNESTKTFLFQAILAIIFLAIFIGVMSLVGCTNKKEAKEILEAEGYTDIQITGYNHFSCSEKDQYKTGFKAKTVKGVFVEG